MDSLVLVILMASERPGRFHAAFTL